MKPRYEHDCDHCTFQGGIGKYDVYICPQMGWPTVVARHGDAGHDYLSGTPLTLSNSDGDGLIGTFTISVQELAA